MKELAMALEIEKREAYLLAQERSNEILREYVIEGLKSILQDAQMPRRTRKGRTTIKLQQMIDRLSGG